MQKTILLGAIALAMVISFHPYGAEAASFQRSLTLGSSGSDVVELQSFLESKGFLTIPGGVAKGYFGSLTQVALSHYQTANNISPAVGYFGPVTQAKVNAASQVSGATPTSTSTVPGCFPGAVFSPTTGTKCDATSPSTPTQTAPTTSPSTLNGGEASLQKFDARSGQAGDPEEGDLKAEVVDFKFNVKDGDIQLNRADVSVNVSNAAENDPWKVFKKAYLMLDGKTIASMSVDSSKNWSDEGNDIYRLRFTNLDSIVREGETPEFSVAFDIASSVDGSNSGDASYSVFIPTNGIRSLDGAGIDQYIGNTNDSIAFDINEAGQNEKLSVRESSSNPDASTLQIYNNKNSGFSDVLKVNLDAKNSDIELKSLPFTLNIDTASFADVVSDARLMINGKQYNDFKVTGTSTATLTFNLKDENVIVKSGKNVEVTLQLSFKKDTNYVQGTNVTAFMTSDNVDAIDAEGKDDLKADQLNGSAEGEAQTLRESGIIVSESSMSAEVSQNSKNDSSDDQGNYTIRFSVQAFNEDIYIPLSAIQGTTTAGVTYQIEDASNNAITTGTSTAVLVRVSGGKVSGNYVRINEGQTAVLELKASFDPEAADFYRAQLLSVNYATSASEPTVSQVVSPEQNYETSVIQVRN